MKRSILDTVALESSLNAHDRQLFNRARDEANHAFDTLAQALDRLTAMDTIPMDMAMALREVLLQRRNVMSRFITNHKS
jgi:hypothetical protein